MRRRRRRARRAAEAAIAAAERRLADGGDEFTGGFVGHLPLAENQRALAGALVDHLEDAGLADERASGLQRAVQGEALLAVDHLDLIDAGLAGPGSAITENG